MDPNQKRELKRQAFLRLAAQRRRAGLLRGRVVVISLLCFALLWGIVFAQMATGNDPVLSAKRKTVATSGRSASRRHAAKARVREVETEAEPETEPEVEVEEPAVVEEAEPLEAEPEVEEPAFEEPVIEEEEPLVTSQS